MVAVSLPFGSRVQPWSLSKSSKKTVPLPAVETVRVIGLVLVIEPLTPWALKL